MLDHRARGQARATAEQLLTLRATDVAVLQADGSIAAPQPSMPVAPGDRVLVGLGERIGVDGVVERGSSMLDASLVTGESLPVAAAPGTQVFAGTLNLGEALTVRATATGDGTLLAECARLIEAAEARRSRFVVLADRVARRYAPAVHLAALATFLWWYLRGRRAGRRGAADRQRGADHHLPLRAGARRAGGAGDRHRAAVPRRRAAEVADRAGAAGRCRYGCIRQDRHADRAVAGAGEGSASTRPRCALPRRLPRAAAIRWRVRCWRRRGRLPWRMTWWSIRGRACAAGERPAGQPGVLRRDPAWRCRRPGTVAVAAWPPNRCASALPRRCARTPRRRWNGCAPWPRRCICCPATTPPPWHRSPPHSASTSWQAGCSPVQKVAAIEALTASGRKVLMVGDGLNDSPSLAAASVSASPASAADISQTVADVVFQGSLLAPVAAVVRDRAARADRDAAEPGLSIGYNVLMVPLAVAGFVTPWLAAAAMSSSSLLVMANSFRLRRRAA